MALVAAAVVRLRRRSPLPRSAASTREQSAVKAPSSAGEPIASPKLPAAEFQAHVGRAPSEPLPRLGEEEEGVVTGGAHDRPAVKKAKNCRRRHPPSRRRSPPPANAAASPRTDFCRLPNQAGDCHNRMEDGYIGPALRRPGSDERGMARRATMLKKLRKTAGRCWCLTSRNRPRLRLGGGTEVPDAPRRQTQDGLQRHRFGVNDLSFQRIVSVGRPRRQNRRLRLGERRHCWRTRQGHSHEPVFDAAA